MGSTPYLRPTPCVYCGGPPQEKDHVRPLSQLGKNTVDNLVWACHVCNQWKKGRLLTQWDVERVAHGMTHSPVVAAEYARLMVAAATPVDDVVELSIPGHVFDEVTERASAGADVGAWVSRTLREAARIDLLRRMAARPGERPLRWWEPPRSRAA